MQIAAEEMNAINADRNEPVIRVAGICGRTKQAVREAEVAVDLNYHTGLLSLKDMSDASPDALLEHCRAAISGIRR